MTRVIIFGLLIMGIMLFLGTYEGFNLMYFEENEADKFSIYSGIPILGFVSIFSFADKYRHSIKDNKLINATKHSLAVLLGVGLLFYFILVPVISGTIIWTNHILGGENVLVKGVVIDKVKIDGTKLSEYELTVKTNRRTITWDTNRIETSKYKVGDYFTMEMKKGFWGLLTKDK